MLSTCYWQIAEHNPVHIIVYDSVGNVLCGYTKESIQATIEAAIECGK